MNEPSSPSTVVDHPTGFVRRIPSIGWALGSLLVSALAVTGWLTWVGGWRPAPQVADGPLPQAVYLWQRQWTSPVRAAVRGASGRGGEFGGMLVFGAEIEGTESQTQNAKVTLVTGLDWSLLAGMQSPVGIVVRVRGIRGPVGPHGKMFEVLRETLRNLCAQAKRSGINLEEVQVDFDCPTSRLRGFAEVLATLRRELPGERCAIDPVATAHCRCGTPSCSRCDTGLWMGKGVDGLLTRRKAEAQLVERAG